MLMQSIISLIVVFLIAFVFIVIYAYITYTHISINEVEDRLIKLEEKQSKLENKLTNIN